MYTKYFMKFTTHNWPSHIHFKNQKDTDILKTQRLDKAHLSNLFCILRNDLI